jgi:hypothetical protein
VARRAGAHQPVPPGGQRDVTGEHPALLRGDGAARLRHLHVAVEALRLCEAVSLSPATQNPTLKSLVPDLYDRFAAPIEKRYSERGARALAEQAGCRVRRSAFLRGWAVWAEKI